MTQRPAYPAFVGKDRQLLQLVARVHDLNRLATCVRAALPPALAASCLAVTLEGDTLVLGTTSPAAAARIKQFGDTLLAAIRQDGWQATAIRPKVQVALRQQKSIPAKDLAMGKAAVAAFEQLAGTLEQGALRDAVERLARRHRNKQPR